MVTDLHFIISKKLETKKYKRLIVSIGSGSCETELYARDTDLIVCLDNNRGSLFAAAYNSRARKKKNLIISRLDMKNGIIQLINNILVSNFVDIDVLFQHPSPTDNTSSRQSLSNAGKDCITSLLQGKIRSIHFVHDIFYGRNCWGREDLRHVFTKNCEQNQKDELVWERAKIIATKGDTNVNHPLFGTVP